MEDFSRVGTLLPERFSPNEGSYWWLLLRLEDDPHRRQPDFCGRRRRPSLPSLMHRWREGGPEEPHDCSVVGAYLAEFKEGLTRDELAEALDWTLPRADRTRGRSMLACTRSGMRLALNSERIVVVGRLDRTELPTRLQLGKAAS